MTVGTDSKNVNAYLCAKEIPLSNTNRRRILFLKLTVLATYSDCTRQGSPSARLGVGAAHALGTLDAHFGHATVLHARPNNLRRETLDFRSLRV
ncbi:UNVERIFIED_CONTAM: hypothetical protein Sindi_2886700 [Sesamum indicum]